MDPETRASLLARLHDRSDQRAWAEFVALYEPIIRATALRGGLQHADAQEITQDVLLSVAKHIERFDTGKIGRFRGWLAVMTRNQTVDFLRRRRECGTGTTDALWQLGNITAPDPAADFDLEHRRSMLRRAAADVRQQTGENAWRAFWLTSVEGVKPQQAAQQLGIDVGTVYVARCRILARLRKWVEARETEISEASTEVAP